MSGPKVTDKDVERVTLVTEIQELAEKLAKLEGFAPSSALLASLCTAMCMEREDRAETTSYETILNTVGVCKSVTDAIADKHGSPHPQDHAIDELQDLAHEKFKEAGITREDLFEALDTKGKKGSVH